MEIELTQRQRQILVGVVEEHVASGEPVGSKTLVERTSMSVSSSTVRNDFAALEALQTSERLAMLGLVDAAGRRGREDPVHLLAQRLRLALGGLGAALDHDALARMEQLGLAERCGEGLALTRRGRFLGGAVTAELLA